MKISRTYWMGLLVVVFTFGSSICHAANLYSQFASKKEVKFLVLSPTDSSKDKKSDLQGLKSSLEEALTSRKSIHFVPATSPSDADVVIEADVQDFYWSPTDPVDMLIGTGAIAMDAMKQEPYARMQARFVVKDKLGKELWKENVVATLTQAGMKESESANRINPDMAKSFIKSAFSKKKQNIRS